MCIINLTWNDLEKIVERIAEKIKNDGIPDIIIAIQRGGFIPAVILSHALGVRNIIPLNIRVTVDDSVNSQKMQPIVEHSIDIQKVKGKKIMIVDDIIGSGITYQSAFDYLLEYAPASIKSFICIVNKNNWEKHNCDSPNNFVNYIGMEVRGWVEFPWERLH